MIASVNLAELPTTLDKAICRKSKLSWISDMIFGKYIFLVQMDFRHSGYPSPKVLRPGFEIKALSAL